MFQRLGLRHPERVALIDVARGVALVEPFLPLSAGTVRPGFRTNAAGGRFLDTVVTNRGSGGQSIRKVLLRDRIQKRFPRLGIFLAGRIFNPESRVTIGLEFRPDRP